MIRLQQYIEYMRQLAELAKLYTPVEEEDEIEMERRLR